VPRILLNRIGDDTLAKLEAAATRRHAEARRLRPHEPLGALYLYGYTIEMRLKAAYYRLTGVPNHWKIDSLIVPNPHSPRKTAQNLIKNLVGLAHAGEAGHHLIGWARLVTDTRVSHVLGPFDAQFETLLRDHVQAAARHWREILRYRANRPYHEELDEVANAADWLQRNFRRLWS
jgi:hypothetical protein